MSERIFLEKVGNFFATNAIGSSKVWEVRNLKNIPSIPPLIYVVESEVGQQFLLGRGLSGRPKFNLIRYIAKAVVEVFFEQWSRKDLSQYLILRGGYPFDLQYAIGSAPPFDLHLLPTSFIRLQRVLNQEGTDWEVQDQPLIGQYRGETWLIPDATIASGSTISFFLRKGFEHHLPKEVYVLTACGSLEGIQRIYQQCQKKGVKLIPIFSQCIFEVSKVGNLPRHPLTDLSVLSPGSITTEAFYQKAYQRYQGKRMCCVGNFSESLEDPIGYSIHTLWEMQVLGMDPRREDWEAWTINIQDKHFQKRLLHFNPALFDYFQEVIGERPS